MGSEEKPPLNVFIDSCILLNIYELSGPDLDEFKKIAELARSEQIILYCPDQVLDEFWRNREGSVADALKKFKETKAISIVPNLMRSYPKVAELQSAIKQVNTIVKEISTLVEADIGAGSLKADEVIIDLLGTASTISIREAVLAKAKLRTEKGNPPGKRGSLVDAINWEVLLEAVPNNNDIAVISSDGDYEAPLSGSMAKEFLLREWKTKKNAEMSLYKSLPSFLAVNFPGVEFSDELAKIKAIERLELSGSFRETHSVIAQLGQYADYSEEEIERILDSYSYNSQVRQILRDDDISDFAWKILKLADEAKFPLAKDLKQKLEAIETE